MDQDFYYHNLQFITLTNKKNIYQDSQYLLNDIYFKKSTDFERIKKHVLNASRYNKRPSITKTFQINLKRSNATAEYFYKME